LASRGYLVISPEFRGSAGYGQAHQRAGYKQFGRAMQDDVADALQWAQQKGWAGKACIMGASYGGYASLMGPVRHPDTYQCAVAWVAMADLFLYLEGSFWTNDDIGDFGRERVMPQRVGDADKDRAMLSEVSPVLQAARIKRPVLLAYGERDLRVPLKHGERMRDALRAAGNEPEWVVYPGEAHTWMKEATHVDFATRVEKFLGQHLR
jgi:dipeptidyl aminopeptidase/acylaminoacyl peptidase